MYIKMGNLHYFIYIVAAVIIILLSYFILRNKSKKVQYWTLFSLLLVSFIVHFLKIFIYPYTTLGDNVIRKISFENISATHTLLFPWIFLSKNKSLKDYFVMAGITAGLVPLLIPLDAISASFDGQPFPLKQAYSIEVIRFYFAHLIMMMVPLLTMVFGLHDIKFKRAYKVPILFLGVLTILFFNELLLVHLGVVDRNTLYDPSKRNPSFIFGIRADVMEYAKPILIFVPLFMRNMNSAGGFWPIFWMIGPILVYGNLFVLIYTYLFDKKTTKQWIRKILFLKPTIEEVQEKYHL